MFLKNVGKRTILMEKIVWPSDRIIDLDLLDDDLLSKNASAIMNNLDKGWIILVDETGKPVKAAVDVNVFIEKRKSKLLSERMALVEYAKKSDSQEFDFEELKKVGEKFVLRDKIKLRSFLEAHHEKCSVLLKSEKWTIDDIDDLKLLHRHEHRKTLHNLLRNAIWKIEHSLKQ